MEILTFSVSTALISFITLIIITFSAQGCNAITISVHNNCTHAIWPGILTAPGSPPLNPSGLHLIPNSLFSFNVSSHWSGRIWARTLCARDESKNLTLSCATGDCRTGRISCVGNGGEPPATLVEFTLNGYGDTDFFDISLVDGFNLPVQITPVGGSNDCISTTCKADINRVCPPELAVSGTNGKVIACKSACLAFQEPQYCCTENHSSPSICQPTKYSRIFKDQCPKAYSYAYDDSSSTFTCASGGDYAITFCPRDE